MNRKKLLGGVVVVAVFGSVGTLLAGGFGDGTPEKTVPTAPTIPTLPAVPQKHYGYVLPFKVLYAYKSHVDETDPPVSVGVSVSGGDANDWITTTAFVAKQSLISGSKFIGVQVFQDNPWGERGWLFYKNLADASLDSFGGATVAGSADPSVSFVVNVKPKMADPKFVEASELSDEYFDGLPPSGKPEKANQLALDYMIRKYHLPRKWKPGEDPSYTDMSIKVDGLTVETPTPSSDLAGLAQLKSCLTSDQREGDQKGCMSHPERYPYILPESKRVYKTPVRNGKPVYEGSNALDAGLDFDTKCKSFIDYRIHQQNNSSQSDARSNEMFYGLLMAQAKVDLNDIKGGGDGVGALLTRWLDQCIQHPDDSLEQAMIKARDAMRSNQETASP